MPENEDRTECDLFWVGRSKDDLMGFPQDVIQRFGYSLHLMQQGENPSGVKPFKGIGSGVNEIVIRYDKEAYRCVQVVNLGGSIYVLHAFHKKSTKGINTPKKEVDLIKQRYQQALEAAKEIEQEKNDEK